MRETWTQILDVLVSTAPQLQGQCRLSIAAGGLLRCNKDVAKLLLACVREQGRKVQRSVVAIV